MSAASGWALVVAAASAALAWGASTWRRRLRVLWLVPLAALLLALALMLAPSVRSEGPPGSGGIEASGLQGAAQLQ